MIAGFLFAGELLLEYKANVADDTQAFSSALGHYLLVRNLNGKLVDTSYLTQSQASAVSILFTTIFKAALMASIGICFAQHLWLILRGSPMALSTVEKLFVIRTNILALGHLRSFWRAPLLFSMASLVWCLGIAMIYPPSMLTVTVVEHAHTEPRNMSVMNPPIPQDLDLLEGDAFPTLRNDHLYSDSSKDDASGEQVYHYAYVEVRRHESPGPALTSIGALFRLWPL